MRDAPRVDAQQPLPCALCDAGISDGAPPTLRARATRAGARPSAGRQSSRPTPAPSQGRWRSRRQRGPRFRRSHFDSGGAKCARH
eukprot:3988161-Pyramimonas_sp.AAC.1